VEETIASSTGTYAKSEFEFLTCKKSNLLMRNQLILLRNYIKIVLENKLLVTTFIINCKRHFEKESIMVSLLLRMEVL
jgi:hypothetical protein